MKKLATALCLAALAAAALAIDSATARAEMDVIGKKIREAFKTENHAYLCGLLDSKFMWKHQHGRPTQNKKQACDELAMFFKQCDDITFSWTVKSMKVTGNKMMMVCVETMSSKMKDEKGKMHTIRGISSVRDTWVKTAQGWKATMFEDLPGEKMWMDGKPFNPGMPNKKK